jgi:hypothetical protein
MSSSRRAKGRVPPNKRLLTDGTARFARVNSLDVKSRRPGRPPDG